MLKKAKFSNFFILIACLIIIAFFLYVGYRIWVSINNIQMNEYEDYYNNSPENPLDNPLIIFNNQSNESNGTGIFDTEDINIDETYIDFMLAGISVNELHKSIVFGYPVIVAQIDDDYWTSEIINKKPVTKKGNMGDEDIKIILSKEEIIKIMQSENMAQFVKEAISNGDIQIEIVAGQAELYSKGYLEIYGKITGQAINSGELSTQNFWARILEFFSRFFEAREHN